MLLCVDYMSLMTDTYVPVFVPMQFVAAAYGLNMLAAVQLQSCEQLPPPAVKELRDALYSVIKESKSLSAHNESLMTEIGRRKKTQSVKVSQPQTKLTERDGALQKGQNHHPRAGLVIMEVQM